MTLQVLIAMVAGWINGHQPHMITYLKEENPGERTDLGATQHFG
jgi:hypothetical protein